MFVFNSSPRETAVPAAATFDYHSRVFFRQFWKFEITFAFIGYRKLQNLGSWCASLYNSCMPKGLLVYT